MFWTIDCEIRKWLPRVQGHRGYWCDGLQQNSLASLKKSYELKYQMCEFDISMTADDEIVLFHDDHFNGSKIKDLRLSDLRRYQPVDKLSEILHWFKGTSNFKLNIEIKSKTLLSKGIEKKISEMVCFYNLEDRVLISSFNPFALFYMRINCSKIRRALLLSQEYSPENKWYIRHNVFGFLSKPHVLHLRYEDFKNKFLKLNLKIPVVLWTVNEKDQLISYKKNIHGVITDLLPPESFQD